MAEIEATRHKDDGNVPLGEEQSNLLSLVEVRSGSLLLKQKSAFYQGY